MRYRYVTRAAAFACAALLAPTAFAEVLINELHYDDATASGDTGERIEVVATAGESLAGYRIYLYNGATPSAATVYDNDPVPVGGLVSCGASVRIATLSYPSNGVQNGEADGLALIDGSGRVVQFLSYEGTIVAGSGPAAGRTSTVLPVSESGATPAGTSLQLAGSGGPANFAWRSSAAQTFGGCNHDQVFGSGGNPPPAVVTTTPVQGASDFPAVGDLAVGFSESVSLASGAFSLACTSSGDVPLSHASSGSQFTIATGTALHAGESCLFTVAADRVTDAGGAHPAQNTTIDFDVASGGSSGDYYARVNTSSPSQLRCSLHATIRGHSVYPYSGGSTDTWDILEIADEDPASPGRILDVYRNRSYAKGSDRAGTGSGLTYNREHTWPNSLGFGSATGDRGLPYAPYTDTHMLYLSDTGYNADRGNKPYAGCASGCGARATEANAGYGGGSARGDQNWVRTPDGNAGSFEVWDHRKGDIARAVMYMAIRYEGGDDAAGQSEPDLELTDDRSRIVKTSASPAYIGLLSTLLAWHQADPPDAGERTRNEVIYSFQGNRNPFIDHPEWATQGLFASSKPPSCQLN
jgi:endonuclease I